MLARRRETPQAATPPWGVVGVLQSVAWCATSTLTFADILCHPAALPPPGRRRRGNPHQPSRSARPAPGGTGNIPKHSRPRRGTPARRRARPALAKTRNPPGPPAPTNLWQNIAEFPADPEFSTIVENTPTPGRNLLADPDLSAMAERSIPERHLRPLAAPHSIPPAENQESSCRSCPAGSTPARPRRPGGRTRPGIAPPVRGARACTFRH